jgi:uncharacterized protein (DUF2164 family)
MGRAGQLGLPSGGLNMYLSFQCHNWFQTGLSKMNIELDKQARAQAIASLQRYFAENLAEPIGDLPAGLLLNFLLEEIGPAVYNLAVADAQVRFARHVTDLGGELFAEEFQYWPRADARRKSRK